MQQLYVADDGRSLVNERRERVEVGDDVENVKRMVATIGNGITLKPSTIPNAGYGVFTTRSFEKNELVTYFDGAIGKRISITSIEASYKTHARRLNGFYTIYGNYTPVGEPIDLSLAGFPQAMGKGGGAFLNAKSGSDANCDWYILRSQSNERLRDETEDPFQIVVLIYAKRKILPGKECFIDYGEGYWREDKERSGTLKPEFITRERYYAEKEEERLRANRRVVKRQTPILIVQQPCFVCHKMTEMVDTAHSLFICTPQCRKLAQL